jgi:hypothetical protein
MAEGTEGWDECTWEGADRRQRRLGLALTPAERLEWLEASLEWIHQVHTLNGVGAEPNGGTPERPEPGETRPGTTP